MCLTNQRICGNIKVTDPQKCIWGPNKEEKCMNKKGCLIGFLIAFALIAGFIAFTIINEDMAKMWISVKAGV